MRLFIAEKPDIAKAIRDALGGGKQQDGHYVCGNDYITWCFGHMLRLADPEEYDPKYKRWNLADLPLCFMPYKKLISDDKKAQVKIILELIKKANSIVHAGDPDDEGQLLVDELLDYAKCNKPVERILMNDNNINVVKKELTRLRPNSEFRHLSARAEARSVGDQLYGYNLSRAYTLATNEKLTVGRVQTPVLGLVVRRCRANASHVKSYFFTGGAEFEVNSVTYKGRYINRDTDEKDDKGRLINEAQIKSVIEAIQNQNCVIVSAVTTAKEQQPVLPYNLLKLQSDASRKFGIKSHEVKDITQSLREKHKLITYNRSDCEYLNDEHHLDAPDVLDAIKNTANIFEKLINKSDIKIKSRAFNSSKVSAHHAIIPTTNTANFDALSDKEQKIYMLIARAYIAQFFPNMLYDETEIITECKGFQFATKSRVIKSLGWKALYKNDADNEDLKEDDNLIETDLRMLQTNMNGKNVSALYEKKETKPLPLYTESTLLNDLTRVAKYIKDENLRKLMLEKDKDKAGEHGGIGTPATRDVILKNLRERGFLTEKGKNIISTPIGERLYDLLPDQAKYPDMTAIWHDQAKAINNYDDVNKFINELMVYIGNEVNTIKKSDIAINNALECPKCKNKTFNRIAIPRKTPFWACSDKENCGHTANDEAGNPVEKQEAVVSDVHKCKLCNNGLIRRTGKAKKTKKPYVFWGCSGYPNCQQTYPDIRGVPDFESIAKVNTKE